MIILSNLIFIEERKVIKEEMFLQYNLPKDVFEDELDGISINIHFYEFEKMLPGTSIAEIDANNVDVLDIPTDYDIE